MEITYRSLSFLGFDKYRIGDDGSVSSYRVTRKGTHRWKLRKLSDARCPPYLSVGLGNGTGKRTEFLVHILVLKAFKGEPSAGQEARHLDGNPKRNLATNLKWGTRYENAGDRIKHGNSGKGVSVNKGETNGSSKLTAVQVRVVRDSCTPAAQLARLWNVSAEAVRDCRNRVTWKHLP